MFLLCMHSSVDNHWSESNTCKNWNWKCVSTWCINRTRKIKSPYLPPVLTCVLSAVKLIEMKVVLVKSQSPPFFLCFIMDIFQTKYMNAITSTYANFTFKLHSSGHHVASTQHSLIDSNLVSSLWCLHTWWEKRKSIWCIPLPSLQITTKKCKID